MLDFENMMVFLALEDDTELACSVVAVFPVGSKRYIALIPNGAECEGAFLYRYTPSECGDFAMENIEDEDEYRMVAEAYDALAEEEDIMVGDDDE